MFYISEIHTTPPDMFSTPLQRETYQILQKLRIPFQRVDTDEAITMEDCMLINRKLSMKMVKTLFLCNRQQTDFYLLITTGDKKFNTKAFSNSLHIPRVSFAPAATMEQMLGTRIGAATVFSALLDTAQCVKIVFDKDVAAEEWYGCSDGTTTGYVRLKTTQIIQEFLPCTGHIPAIAEV